MRPHRDEQGRWRVPMTGTVGDPAAGSQPGSGVAQVELLLRGSHDVNGLAWQPVTLAGDGAWSVEYILPEFDNHLESLPDPSGVYTVVVRAQDGVGNGGRLRRGQQTVDFVVQQAVDALAVDVHDGAAAGHHLQRRQRWVGQREDQSHVGSGVEARQFPRADDA